MTYDVGAMHLVVVLRSKKENKHTNASTVAGPEDRSLRVDFPDPTLLVDNWFFAALLCDIISAKTSLSNKATSRICLCVR